jgi:coproporphyrinogen III oxidase-like Fe-S oxidoreductase
MNGWRWKNVARLGEYLANGPLPPVVNLEHVNVDSRIGEEFMLGLRLIHGLPRDLVERLLSSGERSDARRLAIERHLQSGLLESTDDRLRFSPDGLLLADDVLADLV